MDRNSVIGFVLIAAILFGYTWYTLPSAEERAIQQHQQDSLARVESERRAAEAELRLQERNATETAIAPAAVADPQDSLAVAQADSLRAASLNQQFGVFAAAAEGEARDVVIENENLHITINTHGARPTVLNLKHYRTYHGDPLLLADPDSNRFEFRFFLGNQDISTRSLHFEPEQLGANAVRLRAQTGNPGRYLQITYTLDSASYFMHVRTEIVGLAQEVDPRNIFFHWELLGFSNEKYRPAELQKSSIYFKYFSDDRDYLSETDAEQKRLNGRTNWVAFKQDFFTAAMVSDEGFSSNGSDIAVTPVEDSTHTKLYSAKLYFDKERSAHLDIPMRLYLGPNHYNTLRRTDIDQFDRIIDLGWGIFGWMNRFLVIPIFNFLNKFDLSYGIIIFVLTLVIKLLLMPLTYKNFVASARMRVLKPEMDIINEKHKDGDPLKKQQATMELYRKAGVNPASGCVPMLIQLPILYAMFRFFPASIELRQESFLWADDLSSYDSIMDLPFTIPLYGDHVSLFTLLMAASTIVYSLINQQQMPQQQGMPSMKLLIWMFPIMMLFFLNNFSSGLSYYYLLANVISILQMTLLKKWFVDEDKLRAQLLLNMKTPKKKSRWQQRLEDMQKQQQVAQRKRK
jgi:YidC/Oxa1 family membrane protein insertase